MCVSASPGPCSSGRREAGAAWRCSPWEERGSTPIACAASAGLASHPSVSAGFWGRQQLLGVCEVRLQGARLPGRGAGVGLPFLSPARAMSPTRAGLWAEH